MYATRFSDGPGFRPANFAAALAINGAVVAALLFAAPQVIELVERPPTVVSFIPVEPPPPPKPQPVREAKRALPRPDEQVVAPKPVVDLGKTTPIDVTVQPPPTRIDSFPGTGDVTPPLVEPRFVGASADPRYADDFQPDYPASEREAGNVGIVKLRVLIGTDGRVKQVERIDGGAAFYRAASRHALARWRFRPATRGDIPEESWRTMTVRFTLT